MQVPIPTQKPQNVDIMSGNSILIFYIFQDRRSFVGSFSQKALSSCLLSFHWNDFFRWNNLNRQKMKVFNFEMKTSFRIDN